MLPNAGALHHVALLYFRLGGSSLLLTLSLVSASSSELGLEVVLDLLLAGLLLFLERSEVALASLFLLALLLLGGLLLLLLKSQYCPSVMILDIVAYLLCEVGKHVGDFLDFLVLAC